MKKASDFIRHIQSSPALQSSLSDASWSVASVVEAGAADGFHFTSDEYRAAYGELAREELAAVVGGCNANWKSGSDAL